MDIPLIAVAAQRAGTHDSNCLLCEHRCGVNRHAGELGFCKAGTEARVFRHRVECGEELELIPSHLFYLSGCDLRCAFCIAESNAFNPKIGDLLTPEFLRHALAKGRSQNVRTLQWVGGEPTIHIPAILRAMAQCDSLPRVVWKSDFHGTDEAFDLLEGVIDTFVADFKFGNNDCARRIAAVENYRATVTRNLVRVANQANLIVRHLLLPGHLDCCFKPILEWMAEFLPRAKFSLRDGYLPKWRAKSIAELARPLRSAEAKVAKELAIAAGLNLIH